MTDTLHKKTTLYEGTKVGVVAGLAEIMINHPLWVMKTRMQLRHPFTLNPAILYTGIISHGVSEVLLCIAQIAVSIQIQEQLEQRMTNNSIYPAIIGSLSGGALSGLITSPTELIMTQQQRAQSSRSTRFITISQSLVTQHGYKRLFHGAPCCVVREGLYTCGFFALGPLILRNIQQNQPAHYDKPLTFLSNTIAGIITALLTHPIDTIKSVQQDSSHQMRPLSIYQATKNIAKSSGINGFFSGFGLRALRVASATAIIGTVIEEMRPTYRY